MKKRILSLLCVLCLLLTMLPTSAFAAGYDAPKLSIDASYLAETNQVKMSVKIGAYTDLGALDFHVKYDKEKLKVNGTPTKGGLLTANSTVSDNNSWNPATIGVGWNDENGSTTTTTTEILTVIFDVIEGKTGAVDFSFDEAKYNFCDKSGDNSTDAPGAGSVTSANVTIPKAPISSVTIADLDAPVKGVAPDTSVTVTPSSLAADVNWFDGETPVTGNFAASTKYTVKIKLTASSGDNFAETVTASGYDVTRNSATELLLTKTFDATADKDALPTSTSVSISGTPQIDKPLTANVSGLPTSPGALTYKWYRDGETTPISGADTNIYTPSVAADVGKQIKVEVSAANYDGRVTSAPTAAVEKKDYVGSAAVLPTGVTPTYNSVSFTGTAGQEYVCTLSSVATAPDTGWASVNHFDGLNPDTQYKLWCRVAATATVKPSTARGDSMFTTLKAPATITIADPGTIVYDGSAVEVGSGKDLNYTYGGDGAVTVKWYANNGGSVGSALSGAPTNAGTYWIGVSAAEGTSSAAVAEVTKKFTISPRNISEAAVTDIADKEYTGSSIEPPLTVTYNGAPLTSGADYTEEYTSNLNVGTATAKIKAKTGGNFTGEKAVTFKIKAKAITPVVTVTGSYEYTGDPITPTYKVEITSGGMELPTNQYDAEVSNNTNAGNGNIKITAKANGNYSFSEVNETFTITPKNVADADVTATISNQTTIEGVGEFVDPVIKGVKGEDLTGNLTYAYGSSVSGKSHADVVTMLKTKAANDEVILTYTFTPASTNTNYTGTKTGSFKVTVKDIEFLVGTAPASVANTLTVKSSPVYGDNWSDIVKKQTGVTITAKVGAAIDTEQSHFTLRPTGKPNAGNGQTYELVYNGTINGTNYANVVVVSGTVDVARKDVTATMIAGIPAQTYTGSAIQPKPAVTDGAALSEGTDFSYSYDANTDVATGGKVTITGQGNYKGTADKTFTISPKNINGATINLTSAILPYTGLEQTVSITSVTLTGWTITAGDYDIVGNSDKATNVGSTTLTIQGKGNYTGTATTTWEITSIDPVLANFDVTPALSTAQTYDGAHKTVTVVPKSGVNGMGTVKVYYEATAGITYPKSETAPTDVGTYKVTASVAAGSNYNAKDIEVGTLTINQATGGTLAAYNFQQKYTDLSAKTITPDYSDLPAGQTWTYSTPTPTTSGTAAVTGTSIGVHNFKCK